VHKLAPQKNADYHLVIKQQLKWTADLKEAANPVMMTLPFMA
jgi:hypothetical protein